MAQSSQRSFEEIPAGEFVRNFAQCRKYAEATPLYLTNHGTRTHVLLSADEYVRLTGNDGAIDDSERIDELLTSLGAWTSDAVILLDKNSIVQSVNRVASAICRKNENDMIGRRLSEALPEIVGTLVEAHVHRTEIANTPTAADVPSPFASDGWLYFRSLPWRKRTLVIFRDISAEVRNNRLADVKSAIIEAMDAHGEIAYVRLSLRGTIDRLNQSLSDMIGLEKQRLLGVQFADLVDVSDRVRFREALELVMRGEGAGQMTMSLVSNRAAAVSVDVAIVQLKGAYGIEGAVVLATPVKEQGT